MRHKLLTVLRFCKGEVFLNNLSASVTAGSQRALYWLTGVIFPGFVRCVRIYAPSFVVTARFIISK